VQIPGVESYTRIKDTILRDLQPWYNVFVDAVFFKDLGHSVLKELVDSTTPFKVLPE
jgi:hypothetical protein